jgi:succinate dehydrogenase / fumarate reductase cytochrome b subunit
LVFTILHLITFKWGAYYQATYGGVEMRDLYRLVLEKFSEPLYVGWYIFALLVLFVHMSHGFSAAFQSLGFIGVRNPGLKRTGIAFAILITAGFISQPVYLFLTGGK